MLKINCFNNVITNKAYASIPCGISFKCSYTNDSFEKEKTLDYSNIPDNVVKHANSINDEKDRKSLLEILSLLSKSLDKKTKENTSLDNNFYNDLGCNIFGEDAYLNNSSYDCNDITKLSKEEFEKSKTNKINLAKALIQLKDFPNYDIPIILGETFLSKDEADAKLLFSKYLTTNPKISKNDYSYILQNVDDKKNIQQQIKTVEEFLKNNEYDGDFIPFLIKDVKNDKEAELKIKSYKNFKKLPSEIQSVLTNDLKDKKISNIVSTINFIDDNTANTLMTGDMSNLQQNIGVLCDAMSFKNVKDINETTFEQKEELLQFLRKNSLYLNDFEFSQDFPILPKDSEDFNTLINKLCNFVNSKNKNVNKFANINIDFEKGKNTSYIYSQLYKQIPLSSLKKMAESKDLKEKTSFISDIIKNEEYQALNKSSKKILNFASVFSAVENPLTELNKMQKLTDISNDDFGQIYTIVKNQDLLNQDIEKNDLYFALSLREKDNFKLTKILSSAKSDKVSANDKKNIFEKIENKINSLSETDFILPQTKKEEIAKYAKPLTINGNEYLVADSKDIKDFYSLAHSTEAYMFAQVDDAPKKLEILKSFNTPNNEEIVCCSFITADKCGVAGEQGVLINSTPQNTLAANAYDIHSPRFVDLKQFATDFMKKEDSQKSRKFISSKLQDTMNCSNYEYAKLVKNIIKNSNNNPLSMAQIKELSQEYAKVFSEFINSNENDFEEEFLKDGCSFNEVLVTKPDIQAVYTKSLENLDEVYLNFARKNNLPIVLLSE